MKSNTLTIRKMTFCAIFTALIAVGAFIKIPVPPIPFTLQTMFVVLAGLMLGGNMGGISALLYMNFRSYRNPDFYRWRWNRLCS